MATLKEIFYLLTCEVPKLLNSLLEPEVITNDEYITLGQQRWIHLQMQLEVHSKIEK